MKQILSSLVVAKSKALSALWTFPSILIAALAIAWGAESAQLLISQGLVLATLFCLTTFPEFAVRGVIVGWEK